ncbi:phosphate/phosphite/phosphonate ABC transporter substrate-binding protein, partial [Lactobacillus helveticus]|nr:phosphate/phosphite/phosphonate ABC transporter substrate-binding protein [Lactobacillus helveticus]
MKIKKFLVGAFAVLAALSLSACSGNKKSSSSTNEPK